VERVVIGQVNYRQSNFPGEQGLYAEPERRDAVYFFEV
jgi:hypothetical protein